MMGVRADGVGNFRSLGRGSIDGNEKVRYECDKDVTKRANRLLSNDMSRWLLPWRPSLKLFQTLKFK